MTGLVSEVYRPMTNNTNQLPIGEYWQDAFQRQQQAIEQIQTQIQELTHMVGRLGVDPCPQNQNRNDRRFRRMVQESKEESRVTLMRSLFQI